MNLTRVKDTFTEFKGVPFRPHQEEAIQFALESEKKYVVIEAPTGCLAEGTVVNLNRGGRGFSTPIERAVKHYQQKGDKRYNWDLAIPTNIRSYNGREVGLSLANDFLYSGKREVMKLTLANGYTLRATPDHLIMTKRGYVRMDVLSASDMVLCDTLDAGKGIGNSPKNYDLMVCNFRTIHGFSQYGNFHQGVLQGIKVVNVVSDGYSETYDISVPGNNNFVANGIIVHNSGKTLIAMVAGAAAGSCTYMVHSKVLQNQVTDDFPEARSLFGKSNYECIADRENTCNECTHSRQTPCDGAEDCVYNIQKKAVLASRLRILNYDYFLAETNYIGKFRGSPFLVIDEADNLENTLIGFTSLIFTKYALQRLGITVPTRKTTKSKDGLQPWIDFACIAGERIKPILKNLNSECANFRAPMSLYETSKLKEKMKVTHLLEKVDLFIDNVDETWLFDDAQENKLIFRPLWMNEDLSHKFLWQHGGKFVLMSASFLPQHILAKTLGIPPEEIDYMCVQSTFPPERRPVSIEPVANLTAKTMELEVPKLINRIREIIDARPGVKGMIHCVSYKLGLQIMQGLKNPRLMIHNSFNRQEILKKFMDSPDSDILISPSMERGVSFEQDLCRFIIVAKAPYKNLGDKIVSARVYSSGKIGKDWYFSQMLLTTLQMTGRGMRSEDDFCETFILDEQFNRVLLKRPLLLPEWWRDAILY